jgi:two-component system cell cycle response regulator
MALYDALTGLNNRRSLERRLPAMIETAHSRGAALTMMILDIDYFKRVNDTHGHDVGDLVLKGFAAQLQEIVRGADLLCRLGGEEFVVVMPEVDANQAARIAERARRTTESREFIVDGVSGSVSITVSIGLAEWREKWDSAELYRRADRALYLSKSAGRNRVTQDAA